MKKILFLLTITGVMHPSMCTASKEENNKKVSFANELMRLIDKHEEEEYENIMKYGADVNYIVRIHPTTNQSLNMNPFQYYIVNCAKKRKGLLKLSLYVKYDARADVVDKDGNNPLHLYLMNDGKKLLLSKFKAFIEAGLNVYQKNKSGKSAIHYLPKNGGFQMVRNYIKKREDEVKEFIKEETKDDPNHSYAFMLCITLLFVGNI